MIEFAHPEILWLLFIVPILVIFRMIKNKKMMRIINRHIDNNMFKRLRGENNYSLKRIHFLIEIFAIILLIIGASGLRIGTNIEELKREGVDIIVALDLSNSMAAMDISPSRLERSKFELKRFIGNLKGDRIGLIGFAGVAHLQCPLTLDHRAASMLLNIMDEKLLPVQGTAIADAINIAVKSFSEDTKRDKALIIISDGEDHEQNINEAIENAKGKGVIIYSLGVGTLKGGPIPIYNKNDKIIDYKRDDRNEVITTELQESTLKQIARKTNGEYLRLNETKSPLNKIYKDINTLNKEEFKTHGFTKYKELFQVFLTLALILLLLEYFLPYYVRKKSVVKNGNSDENL